MKRFYKQDSIEIGIDEAGRGCLIGPVCVSGVIMGDIESTPHLIQLEIQKNAHQRLEIY